MSKFTPGPWFKGYEGGITGPRSSMTVWFDDEHANYTAVAWPIIKGPGNGRKLIAIVPDGEDADSDTALIAAAPDMYEALKWAIEYTKKQLEEGYSFKDKDAPHWRAALAAIAKADGKS